MQSHHQEALEMPLLDCDKQEGVYHSVYGYGQYKGVRPDQRDDFEEEDDDDNFAYEYDEYDDDEYFDDDEYEINEYQAPLELPQ
jgi:hypothetical protein